MKKKLITSALPYVNNVPHLGNIIGCVLSADVYARFCRMRGYETRYICGTDEYGTATENKAREEGLTPRQICDKYFEIHRDIYDEFQLSFDAFGRTSTPVQTDVAQAIFKDLDEAGLIEPQTNQRLYCEHDAMFLADRYVEGTCPVCAYEDARGDQCDNCGNLLEPETLIKPRCKVCGNPPVMKQTKHLYLKLDDLQPKLREWFDQSSKTGKWTRNSIQTTEGWLDRGLQPRPITRDLKWGVPVPKEGFEDKVFYVWFDAPIGYISITAKAFDDWRDWWQNPEEVELYQFMAKDNIPFHTVIFPASQLGTGKNWTKLHHINATEYLNYENTKFSKSRNVGVFGTDVRETQIPVDLWRFYLLLIRPERSDSSFNWTEFYERVNAEFIDNIGNLVNRALVYLTKNFDGALRDLPLDEAQQTFVETCETHWERLTQALEAVKLREGLRTILDVGNVGNKFFQDMAPWERIKTDRDHAHATVSLLAYLVRGLGIALEPYMPSTSRRMLDMLKVESSSWDSLSMFKGLDGHQIGKPAIIYRKLDVKDAAKFRKKFSGEAPQFGKFDIRVGQIKEAQAHPTSDRLYVLKVDIGEEKPRSIVAGLVKHYLREDLQNRQVLVLANLTAAELQGVISEGMVLVGEKRKKMALLEGDSFELGARVELTGHAAQEGEIDIHTFKSAPFSLKDHQVLFDDEPLTIAGQFFGTKELANGKIR